MIGQNMHKCVGKGDLLAHQDFEKVSNYNSPTSKRKHFHVQTFLPTCYYNLETTSKQTNIIGEISDCFIKLTNIMLSDKNFIGYVLIVQICNKYKLIGLEIYS